MPPNKLVHNGNANEPFSKALKIYCEWIQLVGHGYPDTGEETPPSAPWKYELNCFHSREDLDVSVNHVHAWYWTDSGDAGDTLPKLTRLLAHATKIKK